MPYDIFGNFDYENNAQVFKTWGPSYKIEFDLMITKYPEGNPIDGKSSIIVFTPNPNTDEWDLPGVYFINKDGKRSFWFSMKHENKEVGHKHIKCFDEANSVNCRNKADQIKLNHNYHIGKFTTPSEVRGM